MTERDLEVYTRFLREWANAPKAKRILMVCPCLWEVPLVKGFFPDAEVEAVQYPGSCDLNRLRPGSGSYDLVFVSNTFMCSSDPASWMTRLLEAGEYIVVQDLIRAWRNGTSELSPETGDVMRYSFPSYGELARVDSAFDLESLWNATLEVVEFYSDGAAHGGRDCRKFIAVFKKKREERKVAGATRGRADSTAPVLPPAGGEDR